MIDWTQVQSKIAKIPSGTMPSWPRSSPRRGPRRPPSNGWRARGASDSIEDKFGLENVSDILA